MALMPTQRDVEDLAKRYIEAGDTVRHWALAFTVKPLAVRLLAGTGFAIMAILILTAVGLANTSANPMGYLVGWVLVIGLAVPLQYLKKSHVVVLTNQTLIVIALETSAWKAFTMRPESESAFRLSALPPCETVRKRTFTQLKLLHPQRGIDLRLLHRAPKGAKAQVDALVNALTRPAR